MRAAVRYPAGHARNPDAYMLGVGGGIVAIALAIVAVIVVNAVYVARCGPGVDRG